MKKFIMIFLLVNALSAFKYNSNSGNNLSKSKSAFEDSFEARLLQHANKIRLVTSKNQDYNDEIVFFVDMKIPSGKNRFFIYDLKNNKIIDQGLVAHGLGSETGTEGKLKFSNANNSLCTSLGKYYVGNSYNGKFGKAYRLYGLDKTNSNAYNRSIVLHKYEEVPYEEQKESICKSFGCPMVNEKYFNKIESILDHSEKKIILEIYY